MCLVNVYELRAMKAPNKRKTFGENYNGMTL